MSSLDATFKAVNSSRVIGHMSRTVSKSPTISVSSDVYKISQALGNVLQTINYSINSPMGQAKLFDSIERSVVRRFYPFVDGAAMANQKLSWHMYEPGNIGNSASRLFALKRQKTSDGITFTIVPIVSKKPSQLTALQKEPGRSGRSVKALYPFRNRFLVGEFDLPVRIMPKRGRFLVFEQDNKLVFTRKSITAHPGKHSKGFLTMTTDRFFQTVGKDSVKRTMKRYAANTAKAAEDSARAANIAMAASDALAKGTGEAFAAAVPVIDG